MLDKRDIGRKPRHALVDIIEGLEIREMHHDEECLLKEIFNGCRRSEYLSETFLDLLRNSQRVKG